jgi:hypothetical protein
MPAHLEEICFMDPETAANPAVLPTSILSSIFPVALAGAFDVFGNDGAAAAWPFFRT